jgi:hypothetical protein
MVDGQSASQCWCQTSIWVPWTIFIFFKFPSDSCRIFYVGCLLWREDGSVVYICYWACQRSLSQIRVQRDSWPYLSVSNFRLLSLVISPRQRLHRKRVFHYCVFSPCRENNASTELLTSKGRCAVACLHGSYFAMGLHVTDILQEIRDGAGSDLRGLDWSGWR